MRKARRSPASECEYLVGDDSCRAVKDSDMGALRQDQCHNETRDTCCYSCDLRKGCDISCDLLETPTAERRPKKAQPPRATVASALHVEIKCRSCAYYLKPKCPRGYSDDTDLWRRQDPCDTFRPAKTGRRSSEKSL